MSYLTSSHLFIPYIAYFCITMFSYYGSVHFLLYELINKIFCTSTIILILLPNVYKLYKTLEYFSFVFTSKTCFICFSFSVSNQNLFRLLSIQLKIMEKFVWVLKFFLAAKFPIFSKLILNLLQSLSKKKY